MTNPILISKLAAILAADVVGFSLKMGENEYLTIKNLKACRSIVDSAIKNNQGRIFTTAGDSVIAEFASPVNAIAAALEFQKKIILRNTTCAEEDRMQFRVGLNLGDVIIEEDNLYGDGVNVAARIEAISEPDGICVSSKFFEEVRRKLDLRFESLGEMHFKNIIDPVKTYRLIFDSKNLTTSSSLINASKVGNSMSLGVWRSLRNKNLSTKTVYAGIGIVLLGVAGYWGFDYFAKFSVNPLSIVVVPFTNLTGDMNQTYIADGLTERITTDLSRIRDALVVDSEVARKYKGKPTETQLITKDLSVRFILRGDVQRSAEKLQINAKLTDAISNKQLWSESFSGEMSDLFSLQDKVTNRISGSLGRQLLITAANESEKRKSNPQASELILRSRAFSFNGQDTASLEKRVELYKEALILEPNNLEAMSGLANVLALLAPRSLEQNFRKIRFQESRDLALKVKEIDPSNKDIYQALAFYDRENDNLIGALKNIEKHVELNNNLVSSGAVTYGNILIISGETKKAIEVYNRSLILDPKNPRDSNLAGLCRAFLVSGEIDLAIDWVLKSILVNPKVAQTWALLAVAYTMKGQTDKATEAVDMVKKLNPNANILNLNFPLKPMSASPQYYKDWYEKKYLAAYRKAGLPD